MNNSNNDIFKYIILILIILIFGPFLIKSLLIFIALFLLLILGFIIWAFFKFRKVKIQINHFDDNSNRKIHSEHNNDDYIDAEYSERK